MPAGGRPLDEASTPAPSGAGARHPRGLRAQLLATRDAAIGLVQAHVDLAKAELSSIAGEIGRIAALAAVAIVVVILAGLLAVIGTALFLGEWLLGSIGWGLLHGLLAFTAIAVAAGLMAAGVSARRVGGSFIVGVVVAVLVGVALGLEWPNQAYAAAGEAARLNVEVGVRPLAVGLLIGALVGVLIGFAAAVRVGSGGARVGAIVGLALFGALVGAFTAITFGPQMGAGVGIAVGYLTWMAVMAADVARKGIDVGDLQERFYPTQTIETGKETLEWLQKRMPPGIGS